MWDLDPHPAFDIWALGVNLFYIMARKYPYAGPLVLLSIEENKREILPEHYS